MELVRPPEHVLLRASPKDRDRASLRRALLPRMREVLARVCLWDPDSAIGDYAFCVFSYNPRRQVQVYLQIWSEPDDVVVWEVSSGNWHAPTKDYMRGARSDAVRRAGFRIGGEARNFQRQVQIETLEHVDALAAAIVDLLYDALGYRGRQMLNLQAIADTDAPRRPVYETLTSDQLARLLRRAGFECEEQDSYKGGEPVLVTHKRQRATVLLLSWSKDAGGYTGAAVGPAPDDYANGPFVPDSEVAMMEFTGGVTAEWIVANVGSWFAVRRRERRVARRSPAAQPMKTAERVH
jgi:hypothetical protein